MRRKPILRSSSFAVKPLQARRHLWTVKPGGEIKRRPIAPFPQICAKAGTLREAGTLLRTATVSLLGDASHQLQHIALVAIREARANLETLAKIELVLSTVASQRRQEPADVSANIAEWKAELLRRSGIRDD